MKHHIRPFTPTWTSEKRKLIFNDEFFELVKKEHPTEKQKRPNKQNMPKSKPCLHPELEGIWVKDGLAYKVTWNSGDFEFYAASLETNCNGMSISIKIFNNDDGWTQIERAPRESIAGPKLERPRMRTRIKTPVDPYDIG